MIEYFIVCLFYFFIYPPISFHEPDIKMTTFSFSKEELEQYLLLKINKITAILLFLKKN